MRALGVTPGPSGVEVAIPAPGATRLVFCVFEGEREVARHPLHRRGEVFQGHIPGLREGARYGLRAEGPWESRFNPQKLLLDPWARALEAPLRLHPSAFDTEATPDPADSGPHLTRAVVQAPLPPQEWAPLPERPEVIYELHVRGFTKRHPDIPEAMRGTFAGLAHPAAIAHLRRLGVTTVELLPTAAWVDERHLVPLGLTNYWGYNPVCWLAPDPRLALGGMAEVRAAVSALREAGIGVILDIVLNHSGEGDALGPTLSLRGLGQDAWYRRRDGRYVDNTGCGNTLALDQPWPLRLAMDALRHWAEQAGVDGFRLDLATTLGRRAEGFDPHAPLLAAMRQDPVLRTRRLIAEPWDLGPDGYQLGRFPHGWPEWNDRFRDDVRRFWRGRESGRLGPLATRLAGSDDVFSEHVADSLNFITAHDGFTLSDLVSHERRHNLANGEDNRDGTADNISWNHGIEGPSDDPAVEARRAGDRRALLATLFAARGLPMLAMGDEAGRSQGGNNNAYSQDNATSWLDWEGMDQGLVDFTARLIAARRAHPALHAAVPLTGRAMDESCLPDVAWLHPDGRPIGADEWEQSRALVALFYARGDRVLVAINGGDQPLALRPPPARWGFSWTLLADSARPTDTIIGELAPRSVVLLAETAAGPRRAADAADPALLAQLAVAAGLAPLWHDLEGREHQVPEGTLRHILRSLGLPAETAAQARDSLARRRRRPPLPAHLAACIGAPIDLPLGEGAPERLEFVLALEDGCRREGLLHPENGRAFLPALPVGRHELRLGDALCRITVAPTACFLPPSMEAGERRFGVTAQSYSLRHAADQGIGDFTAIAELARQAGDRGALWLGISPPHALPLMDRERASPYQPSDRRFLEPMLIDVARLGGAGDFPALRAAAQVDYPRVWQAKRQALHAAWTRFDRVDPAFLAFRAEGGPSLERFAAFNALAERAGHSDARRWPAGLRHGRDEAVAKFRAEAAEEIGFHAWLQFVADRQLAEAAASGTGLYRDLAVGTAPDGAEVWSGEMTFLAGLSIGAPPDPLGPAGQVWGIPPPDPLASEAQGHAAFAALIRANMRHAAALRIDHVLGLKRLFLVPEGGTAAEGCYLAQPFEAWLGEVALESHRAGCVVVGEDLGTVPAGLREVLHDARALSYRVLWFEREGPAFRAPPDYPPLAAACVSTHDLPTLAGWWEMTDIAEREALGLLHAAGAELAHQERHEEQARLFAALRAAGLETTAVPAQGPLPPELAGAIHGFIAATPSLMLLVQAEDLAGERVAVNLPGTDRERPNWRRRLDLEARALFATPTARAILAVVAERGRSNAFS